MLLYVHNDEGGNKMDEEEKAIMLAIITFWLLGAFTCWIVDILTNSLIAVILMIGILYVIVQLCIRLYKGGAN